MDLLRQPPDRGYPADYLLSRIRGKRSGLIRNWKPLVNEQGPAGHAVPLPETATPERLWGSLVREHRWVFGQMDLRMREIFHPYFLYAELRTIFLCLRCIPDRTRAVFDELLPEGLLCDDVRAVLMESGDLPQAVDGIEELFTTNSAKFEGLAAVLAADGLRAVERRMVEVFLPIAAATGHPALRSFFSRLIDARNILSLAKSLRVELKKSFPFIPGGSIDERRLRGIEKKGDPVLLQSAVRKIAGTVAEKPDPAVLENVLYRSMTQWTRKRGRESFGPAPILDYLWRCSIQTMNLSILNHGAALEHEVVAAELVQ